MDLRPIVSRACDEADDFLAGVRKRDEGRAGLAEWVNVHHGRLAPADKKAVIDQAMRILENEGFFEATAGGMDDLADFTGEE